MTIESTREQLFQWFNDRQGEYEPLAARVAEAARGLHTEDMTLHFHHFRFGFRCYYGELEGKRKFVPISPQEGAFLVGQVENKQGIFWPVKDPETGTFFIPKVTVNKILLPEGTTLTGGYFDDMIRWAERDGKTSRYYGILESLQSHYAKEIEAHCNKPMYHRLKVLIPLYTS